MARLKSMALAAAILGLAGATPAMAGVLTFDFGAIGADGGPVCASNCVVHGKYAHGFSIGSDTVLVAAYKDWTLTRAAFVTQKPGPFGSEAGLGESDTRRSPSDANYEIAPGKVLFLDNSGVLGTPVSISIGSLQGQATLAIYTGATSSDMNFWMEVSGIVNPQTVALPGDATFVELIGVHKRHVDALDNDTLLLQEVFSVPEPEPLGLAVLATGLLGIAALRGRKA